MRRRLLLALFCCVAATGCGPTASNSPERRDAWLIHATDPHLFVNVVTDKTTESDKRKIERQRTLNEKGVSDMLAIAQTLVAAEGEPRGVILTGDFDADPCWISGVADQTQEEDRAAVVAKCLADARPEDRERQVKRLAAILSKSSVRDIYVLPGNNDIAREHAGPAALKYFNDFISDVQKSVATDNKSLVQLHNLAGCFNGGADADCVSDIRDTPYRLVGAPSYSFKNADAAALSANEALQEAQVLRFSAMVGQTRDAARKAIVVTHIPNLDDPFAVAQSRYADTTRDRPDTKLEGRSASSAWNVTQPVIDAWTSAVGSETVAAVLAGHFHDSHREIYRQPYSWSTSDRFGDDRSKVFVTPPLSVKNQDGSPAQARGFSLIHLQPDRVRRTLYWYDTTAGTFAADVDTATERDGRGLTASLTGGVATKVQWLWNLTADPPVERLAVLLIAFLAAFLTVARVWKIPPAPNSVTGAQANDATAFRPSPFEGPFGATVIAGLAGLVAATVVTAFSEKPSATQKEFYIVWFVVLFFLMLIIAALLQGALEGMRARLAIVRFTSVPEPTPKELTRQQGIAHVARQIGRWIAKPIHWLYSWRHPFVVALDTFLQRIQGNNQTLTSVFTSQIERDQVTLVRVAETIRKELNELLERRAGELRSTPLAQGDIRVNISVMSSDASKVSYIATSPGSAQKEFPKLSVAWVSVFRQRARWFKRKYRDDPAVFDKIVLFEGDDATIFLKTHYQPRDDDYEAFVVFPVPGSHRDATEQFVRGAMHISFRRQDDFERFWKIGGSSPKGDPVLEKDSHKYGSATQLVEMEPSGWCLDSETCYAIRGAIRILGELLKGFNENVYTTLPRR